MPDPADADEAAAARLAAAIVAAADAGDPAGPRRRTGGPDDGQGAPVAGTVADADWAAALAEPIAGPMDEPMAGPMARPMAGPLQAGASAARPADPDIGGAVPGAPAGLVDALLDAGDDYSQIDDGYPDDPGLMAAVTGEPRRYAQTDDDLLADEWLDPDDFDTDRGIAAASALELLEDPDFSNADAGLDDAGLDTDPDLADPDLDLAGLPKPIVAGAGFEAQDEPEPDFDALRLDEDPEFNDDSVTRDRRLSDTDRWMIDKALHDRTVTGSRIRKTGQ